MACLAKWSGSVLEPSLRVHIQMSLQDDTAFEELHQKTELYEQVSQRWSAEQIGLQLMVKPWGAHEQDKTAGPMDVDAMTYKGGKKGGKKGGGKKDEKGKNSKGKSFWSKDGGKKGGKEANRLAKSVGKKRKGSNGACHNCGKQGHYARDCWAPKRVQEVAEKTGQMEAKAEERVRLVTPMHKRGFAFAGLHDHGCRGATVGTDDVRFWSGHFSGTRGILSSRHPRWTKSRTNGGRSRTNHQEQWKPAATFASPDPRWRGH